MSCNLCFVTGSINDWDSRLGQLYTHRHSGIGIVEGTSMQQLKELLELAVGQATFDAGRVERNEGGLVISFASRPHKLVAPRQLSHMIATKGWEATRSSGCS